MSQKPQMPPKKKRRPAPPNPKPCPTCYSEMLLRDGSWVCRRHGVMAAAK